MRPCRVLAFILIVMLFPPGVVWAQQTTIYGCVKNNNGQIRIVNAGDVCLPSEHSVQWTLGGGTTTTNTPPTPGPLRVIDQNSVAVGVFVPPSGAARLAGDQWVLMPVGASGFQVTDPAYFTTFYQTTDCSGDAYLPADSSTLLRSGTVLPGATAGQLVFTYAGKPEVDRTTIHAFARIVGGLWTCYGYTPGPSSPPFGKAATMDVSSFVAPFKITQ